MALSFGGKNYNPRRPRRPKPGLATSSIATAARPSPGTPTTPQPIATYTQPQDQSWQDQTYHDTIAGVDQRTNNLKTYLASVGDATGTDYGIQFDRDPNNPLLASNFRIDPNVDVNNPFSKAALLKRTHQQATRGNTNSYAARGQLYSGALQNAQNEAGFQKQQGDDALLKDFAGKWGGLYQSWLAAQSEAGGQKITAQAEAQARNVNTPAPAQTFKNIPMKNATAAGLTFKAEGGTFVVYDKAGKKIPGATLHVQGGKHFVRVPG